MKSLKDLRNRIRNYAYDSTINIKDRMVMVFSAVVLVALFLAIPAGLIMREPLSATISTLFGAVIFTTYVVIVFI